MYALPYAVSRYFHASSMSLTLVVGRLWAALPARHSLSLSTWSFLVILLSIAAFRKLSLNPMKSSLMSPEKSGSFIGQALASLSE